MQTMTEIRQEHDRRGGAAICLTGRDEMAIPKAASEVAPRNTRMTRKKGRKGWAGGRLTAASTFSCVVVWDFSWHDLRVADVEVPCSVKE